MGIFSEPHEDLSYEYDKLKSALETLLESSEEYEYGDCDAWGYCQCPECGGYEPNKEDEAKGYMPQGHRDHCYLGEALEKARKALQKKG